MASLFQDELNLLKEAAREWVRFNPRLGRYFGSEATDPDVEHLMEGFAFLTGHLREKIDDQLPEFTDAVIERVQPNFLRPFPPAAMLKFTPLEKAITQRQVIRRGARMFSPLQQEAACLFRTTADCTIYPLEIAGVHSERTRDRSVIEVSFATLSGLSLSGIGLSALRLNFCGAPHIRQMLYLWMCRHLKRVEFRPKGKERGYSVPLPQVTPAALGMAEALLDEGDPAFDGYRLLQEFFCMPDKFYALDLAGLGLFAGGTSDQEFSLIFEFSQPLPVDVKPTAEHIQLYCTPIVNLFETSSEPISFQADRDGWMPLRPASQQMAKMEIFAVNAVRSAGGDEDKPGGDKVYRKVESFEHAIERAQNRREIYWRDRRRPLLTAEAFEHELSFIDHAGKPAVPREGALQADFTCFNGRAAAGLPPGSIRVGTGDVPSFATFANLTSPSEPIHAPNDGSLGWRLISNLSLNITSLNDREAFSSIVSTYDYPAWHDRQADRRACRRAEGLVSIVTRPVDRLFKGMPIRGLRTVMTLKESAFASEGEMLLYTTILSEFMTLYATTNSFHQLEVHGAQSGQATVFPAKAGRQPLI